MPLYDYRCTECGHRFELLRTISEKDTATCSRCGGKVSRVYEGRCAFGRQSTGSGCSGDCKGCSGCGGH